MRFCINGSEDFPSFLIDLCKEIYTNRYINLPLVMQFTDEVQSDNAMLVISEMKSFVALFLQNTHIKIYIVAYNKHYLSRYSQVIL